MAQVVLKNVCKSFDGVEIIKGVDLTILDKEFVVFVGPSGCGKSTLLRLVAGLEEITSGDLFIDGQRINDVAPSDRGLAMVFQSYALYPHMTVADNMAFSLRLARVPREERTRKVREAARILELEPLLDRKPRQLSGGQRQRVAIGRAIVRNPKVFLFDEPLSNLDAALRVQMRIEIARLREELAATMIYVTHDQVEAMTMADKIVVLRAGVVEQVGTPLELYHHPNNLFVAGFIGSPKMNFIDTTVTAADGGTATVTLPGGFSLVVPVAGGHLKRGDKVTLGVRPEHLREDAGGDGEIRGEVIVVERLGGETFLYVQAEGSNTTKVEDTGMFIVQAHGDNPARVHDKVVIGVEGRTCHLFGPDGLAVPRVERHPLADVGKDRARLAS